MRNFIYSLLRKYYLSGPDKNKTEINLNKWENSITRTRKYYLLAYRYFTFFLDKDIVKHRKYFDLEKKGFGEDAFHVMWYLLYKKYNYKNFLEIGVYRGQSLSLNAFLAKKYNQKLETYGISPFDQSGDSVSNYITIDFYTDTLNNFSVFDLAAPHLLKAYSTDEIAIDLISAHTWDCIYIDGSHDIEVVRKDWNTCSKAVRVGGIIVLDDASLYVGYKNPFFAFQGHEGPSIVADEISITNKNFKEVLRVGHNRVFERVS